MTLTLMPSAITAVIAGSPARVAGILISRLGRSTILDSSCAWAMVRGGVVRQPGVDLDGHPAVGVPGGLEGRGEQVAGVTHVVGGDLADGVVDVGAAGGELTDLLLVGRAVLERGLEDRRVGGDPDDVLFGDQVLQVAGLQPLPGQIVQPEGNPGGGKVGQAGCRCSAVWSWCDFLA